MRKYLLFIIVIFLIGFGGMGVSVFGLILEEQVVAGLLAFIFSSFIVQIGLILSILWGAKRIYSETGE